MTAITRLRANGDFGFSEEYDVRVLNLDVRRTKLAEAFFHLERRRSEEGDVHDRSVGRSGQQNKESLYEYQSM